MKNSASIKKFRRDCAPSSRQQRLRSGDIAVLSAAKRSRVAMSYDAESGSAGSPLTSHSAVIDRAYSTRDQFYKFGEKNGRSSLVEMSTPVCSRGR